MNLPLYILRIGFKKSGEMIVGQEEKRVWMFNDKVSAALMVFQQRMQIQANISLSLEFYSVDFEEMKILKETLPEIELKGGLN